MKTLLEVIDRQEAKLIKAGLTDPKTRAFVKVMGALSAIPSDRGRRRILNFVSDKLAEDATHLREVSEADAST